MYKVIILALGLSLTAASCNLFGGIGSSKGVLKSEDGGETFVLANALEEKESISGVNANSFVFDPIDSNTLYIGGPSGIFKTENGAESWRHILAGMRIGDIAVDPTRNDLLYAVGISSNNGRIIKSSDGGETWKDMYVEPTKNNPVLSIAISKANSRVLLAGLNNGEMIRSVDEGVTWQLVRDFSNPVTDIEYVDSTSAYALTLNTGLFETGDQGSNWFPIPVNTFSSTSTKPKSTRIYYQAAYDKKLKSVIFLATDQGLLRTIDAGLTWTLMSLPVTDETLAVTSVTINPSNSNNIFIAVDSTLLKSKNGGVTWETRKLPVQQNVRHILINPVESNLIYLGMGTR